MQKHKASYKMYLEGKTNKKLTSFNLFNDYGIDNINIILVEDYPCNNKYELEARERFYIEGNICLNKIMSLFLDKYINVQLLRKSLLLYNVESNNHDLMMTVLIVLTHLCSGHDDDCCDYHCYVLHVCCDYHCYFHGDGDDGALQYYADDWCCGYHCDEIL